MGRRLGWLIALAALAGGLGGGPAAGLELGAARSAVAVAVDSSPFRVTVLRGGVPVAAEDPGGGIRYQLAASGASYRLTDVLSRHGEAYTVATDEPGRTATVTVSAAGGSARIDVRLHPAAGVRSVYDSFPTPPGDRFLGGGEQSRAVDLRGRILSLEVGPCSSVPIPFFASSAGWGLRLATEHQAAFAFPGSTGGSGCSSGPQRPCRFPPQSGHVSVCVQGAQLDERIYPGTIPQALAAYEADTGLPAVPPPSELELIKWRDVSHGPGDLLEDISRLQADGIPIGWELLDNPWETCNGTLSFDRAVFPHPAEMIRAVHARGVKFMLWISPRETCPAGYPPESLLGAPGHRILDLRDPAALAIFESRLKALVALGVDGFKADRGDENDLESVAPGLTNEYSLLWNKAAVAALPPGGAAIFRTGTTGSQAVVPGIWAGDQEENWQGLQKAIVDAQTAAMSGFPTWGSDIGGYLAPPEASAALFERWTQLGAVSPIFEVGGMGPNATPWTLGTQAMAVLKSSAILHYELYPYLDGLLRRHQPVLRPLAYGYPDDPHAWRSRYELLVGPDLLAAPVTGQGVTPSVYLPPGEWIDLYRGTRVGGGGPSFTRPTPMNQFPLYVRAGAVLPFDLRTASGSWWGVNELTRPGHAGFLATDGASLTLRHAPRDVQIFVPAHARPARVTIAGVPVAWRWNPGPLPGVVVRTHGPVVEGRIVLSSS